MTRIISDVISELMDTHIKLWDIVDMLNSDSEAVLVKATRMDNVYNSLRSNLVEEIDEIVLSMLRRHKKESD